MAAGDVIRPVHPHGRGEHDAAIVTIGAVAGSSPRAWGTQRLGERALDACRFIPTGVGNTRSAASAACPVAVHPHGRGEHHCAPPATSRQPGSSPRAWGTHRPFRRRRRAFRFIPTGVGNTPPEPRSSCARAVHPHGRGEHVGVATQPAPARGSSPRAWGTHRVSARRQRSPRFIPTGVGNTRGGRLVARSPAVHPHGRGEHSRTPAPPVPVGGSSPRAWGTRRSCVFMVMSSLVHPHGRGEHREVFTSIGATFGSSPRAWGTRSGRASDHVVQRFIPTGVGNTP